jgi:hypothetical protein
VTPERWRVVCGILESAIELRLDEMSAFLDRECAADPLLRKDVDDYLSVEGRVDGAFLESPAVEQLGPSSITASASTVLAAGTAMGPYEVQELIGAGAPV